ENASHPIQQRRSKKPPLSVTFFGPGIWKEHKSTGNAGRRQPFEERMHVIGMKPDTPLKLALACSRQGGYDAVNIGFSANEPSLRIVPGLPYQVLTGAEADFEPDFPDRPGKEKV